MGHLKDDLLTNGTELVETHASWVFLGPDTVWKVKKPVDFGFLDFATAEKRKAACEAEVRLNARLAPSVYRGVVPVTRDEAGRHQIGGSGAPVDWAVEMTRLPDAQRADKRLAQGQLSVDDLDQLAERIAEFHARMPTDDSIAAFGSYGTLLGNARENFDQTRDSITTYVTEAEAREIESRQLTFLDEHRELLTTRQHAGRVRDGHGDLRLEHVYMLGGEPVIIDCIEFNERFRYADVCADVAFLAVDLERCGRVDYAERFLAMYARAADDYDLYGLLDFYESYRAFVRGKVSSLLAADPGASTTAHEQAKRDARRYYLLALSTGRPSLLSSAVVCVGGVPASGKSTLSDHLSRLMTAPVVDTDRTRKSLVGVSPLQPLHDPAFEGAYTPEQTAAVYAEAMRRAECVLASGRPVILDASFRSRAHREAARALARKYGVPFYFVESRAPRDLSRARLEKRQLAPSVSDGRIEIFDSFVDSWEPVTEILTDQHIVIDTTQPVAVCCEQLSAALPTWPHGLTQ